MTYASQPSIGKVYQGINPKDGLDNYQSIRRFVLYVIGHDAGKLYFREKVYDFGDVEKDPQIDRDVPGDKQLLAKAEELMKEGLDSFDPVDPFDLAFDRPTVIGIVINDKRASFLEADKKANAIHFPHGKDIIGSQGRERCCNKSFGHARSMKLASGLDMLVVENHHLLAETGEPRKPGTKEIDFYKFDLYVMVELDEPAKASLPIIIDPGPRNMGP